MKTERSHRYSAERKSKPTTDEEKTKKEKSTVKGDVATNKNEEEEIEPNSNEVVDQKINPTETKDNEEAQKEEDLRKLAEERKSALEGKAATEERIRKRVELRENNANLSRPDESTLKKLDSSMKKNTAFVKKLRNMTEMQRDGLVNEFKGLNLTKFIQEAVTAIAEAKIKVSDVGVAACICSLFHQRYNEFTAMFKKAFLKLFDSIDSKEEERPGVATRLRPGLRLLAELVLDGFFTNLNEGVQMLQNIIQTILNVDKGVHVYAAVILTLVRHCGEDLAGIMPRKQRHWKETVGVEFPRLKVISGDQQSQFMCLFEEYYENMCEYLVSIHKDLQNRERQNQQTIGLKGELPADRKESFEKAQKVYDKLLSSTTSFAELFDAELPELPEDRTEEREELGTINIFTPIRGVEYDSETGLWEDDDTRTFYEDIKDLKILLPQIMFKDVDVPSNEQRREKLLKDKKKKERKLRVDLNMDEGVDYDMDDENFEQEVLAEDDEEEDPATLGMASLAESYFQKLPTCVNRDFIDQAAEDFIVKLNTKGNRKKLVKALFAVSRTRLDLLPFYARLVATLAPCLVDIAPDLVWYLKGSFISHLKKKDQIHTESKIKTVRFIGELTKFKVCPKAEALHCLKMLLDNFTHHNIDMACNLLETCGRYLYRSPESNPRMAHLLEQMMRKKSVQTLDMRHSTMIENAFYYCNPPERQKAQRKVRSPLHEFIRKLLYKDLSKTTTEKVLRQIRKLPWNDSKVVSYVSKCLVYIWNVKFNNIRCAANMLSGLAEYHDELGQIVIDGVLENIRLGMETNVFRDNQRRVSCMKYLGEMYNYQLIDSDVIFSTLYLLITFGSCLDMSDSELDPPEHLFRVRLVCTLLDTCGQYFDRGSSKRKLDCFLVYFQCYLWQKKEAWAQQQPEVLFPRDIDYMVSDLFDSLRPNLKPIQSLEEAKEQAEQLNKEYLQKIKDLSETSSEQAVETVGTPPPVSDTPPLSSPLLGSWKESPSFVGSPQGFVGSPQAFTNSSQEEEDLWEGGWEEEEHSGGECNEQIFHMDQEVVFNEKPKHYQCEEDDMFCKQFERLLGDSITDRLHDTSVTPNLDIAIPMNLKGKQKSHHHRHHLHHTPNNTPAESTPQSVDFVIMLKKNNKPVLKDLPIPVTADLAANLKNKQKAERAEKEEMKRLVLDYNQRQEEESYNELMSHFKPSRRQQKQQMMMARQQRGTMVAGQSRLRARDTELFTVRR